MLTKSHGRLPGVIHLACPLATLTPHFPSPVFGFLMHIYADSRCKLTVPYMTTAISSALLAIILLRAYFARAPMTIWWKLRSLSVS